MRIFLNEFRKLFRFPYVLAAIIVFFILLIYVPGNLKYYGIIKDRLNTKNYPTSGRLVLNDSPTLLFSDMLLDKYGSEITEDEVPLVIKQYENFRLAVDTAIKNDDIFQKYAISSYEG